MKSLRLVIMILLGIIAQNAMAATKIVECEDAQGHKAFYRTCPPGTTQVGQKRIATGTPDTGEAGDGSPSISATLYSVPECESCDGVREYLQDRNISITEKNVFDNIELQTEMKDLTGKESVPVTVIGETVLIGYNRTELKQALAAAGYEEKPAAEEQ